MHETYNLRPSFLHIHFLDNHLLHLDWSDWEPFALSCSCSVFTCSEELVNWVSLNHCFYSFCFASLSALLFVILFELCLRFLLMDLYIFLVYFFFLQLSSGTVRLLGSAGPWTEGMAGWNIPSLYFSYCLPLSKKTRTCSVKWIKRWFRTMHSFSRHCPLVYCNGCHFLPSRKRVAICWYMKRSKTLAQMPISPPTIDCAPSASHLDS